MRQIDMFQDVADEALAGLLALSRRRSYRRGEYISGVEQGRDDALVLMRGRAHLYRVSSEGREIILAMLGPGDVLGVVFVHGMLRPQSTLRAVAEGTVVYHIPREHFRQFILAHPQAAAGVIALLSRRLVDAYDLVEDLSFSQLSVRLAHVLARLVRVHASQTVSVTRDELAALIGSSREEVTKALNDFRARGLVEYQPYSRTITIPNPERLAAARVPHEM